IHGELVEHPAKNVLPMKEHVATLFDADEAKALPVQDPRDPTRRRASAQVHLLSLRPSSGSMSPRTSSSRLSTTPGVRGGGVRHGSACCVIHISPLLKCLASCIYWTAGRLS